MGVVREIVAELGRLTGWGCFGGLARSAWDYPVGSWERNAICDAASAAKTRLTWVLMRPEVPKGHRGRRVDVFNPPLNLWR